MHDPDPPEDEGVDPDAARLDASLRAALGRRDRSPEPPAEPDDGIDDGELLAWRAGALDDEAAAAFEARLADDPDARDLAAAHAEPVSDALLSWAEDQAPRAARPRRRAWGGLALAAVALLAVGAGLWMRGGDPPPGYVTSPLGGAAATTRGVEAIEGVPLFRSQGVLEVTLRPEVAGEAPPVSAFVARPDGPLRAVDVGVQTPDGGAIIVRAPAGDLFGAESGVWRFYVALGAPGDAAGQSFERARAGGDTAWFEYPLVFEPAPDDGGAP